MAHFNFLNSLSFPKWPYSVRLRGFTARNFALKNKRTGRRRNLETGIYLSRADFRSAEEGTHLQLTVKDIIITMLPTWLVVQLALADLA